MFVRIGRRITYANVAVTFALIFAMTGGAYAAGKYLITSTKQISPKVLKSLVGKAGPAGKAGSAGPAGTVGPARPAGPAGPKGETGASITGESGKEGAVGPKGATGAPGAPGPKGATGPQGPLQSGKTEMGQWAVAQYMTGESPIERVAVSLGFSIPLEHALGREQVHYIEEGEGENEEESKWAAAIKEGKCKGSVEKPEAAKGNLCVFTRSAVDLGIPALVKMEFEIRNAEAEEVGAGISGAYMLTTIGAKLTKGEVSANGDWVVTAE
jgi:hypothetical protein